jgi:hypothetical protein
VLRAEEDETHLREDSKAKKKLVEVRASRRHRAYEQQRREGTEASSAVAEEIIRDAKRGGKHVCREGIDSDDEFKAARARCNGISDGNV